MTRIIAGELRGRRLELPPDARVRPTADRVREAWMSILGERIPGAKVLDLCAGSGALGLELLSRGAAHADLVDISGPSLATIRANIRHLDLGERATVHRADAERFVARLPLHAYDIAVADPPWSLPLADRLVEAWLARPFARVFSVEHPAARELPGTSGDTRRYGDVALTFFQAP